MTLILGIDPGSETGVATFVGGALQDLETVTGLEMLALIRCTLPARVVFEDSRLETRLWNARGKQNMGTALAAARSVGQVDRLCSMIVEQCALLGIPAHGISPTSKGAKLDAARFKAATGWAARSNQHERDAAMVAWPYRNAASPAGKGNAA